MSERKERTVVTHRLATHPVVMVVVLLCTICFLIYFMETEATGTTGDLSRFQKFLVYGVFGCAIAYYGAAALHTRWISPEGLEYYWLGIRYRTLQWNQVKQVFMARQYKSTVSSIIIVPSDCPEYAPGDDLHAWRYIDQYRLKLTIIDSTDSNIAAIKCCYGDVEVYG